MSEKPYKDTKFKFSMSGKSLFVEDVVSKEAPVVVLFPKNNTFLVVRTVYKRDYKDLNKYKRTKDIYQGRYGERSTFATKEKAEKAIIYARKKIKTLSKLDYVIMVPKSQTAEFIKV